MGLYSYGQYNKDILKDALLDSENDWDFDWDIAFILGDLTESGQVSQYEELVEVFSVLTNHSREDFFLVPGNHDEYGGFSNYRNYVDMLGKNTEISGVNNEKRRFLLENISDDLDGYTISVGNTVFIVMAPSWGNRNYYDYYWWENIINKVPVDKNVICLSHHYVKNSGISSQVIGGMQNSNMFSDWMINNSGIINGWFCGHIHWEYDHPGFNFVSNNWKTFFLCAASLDDGVTGRTASKSIVLTFTEDSNVVQVDDYFHGFSNFYYHNNEEQWDNNDPKRGKRTFNLRNTFNYYSTFNINIFETILLSEGIHSWEESLLKITPDTNILFTVADYGNNLKETRYKIDDGNWKIYRGAFNISEIGKYELSFYSVDKKGRREKISVIPINVVSIYEADDLEPITYYRIEPHRENWEETWYNTNITITLNATDEASGVNKTYYCFYNNILEWIEYTNPITIYKDGIHTLLFYSIDNASNEEGVLTITIKLDKTPPIINISNKPTDDLFFKKNHIKVTAIDINSNVEKLDFFINSKLIQTYNNSFEYLFEPPLLGEYTLKVTGYDIAGNKITVERKYINYNFLIIIISIIMFIACTIIFKFFIRKKKSIK